MGCKAEAYKGDESLSHKQQMNKPNNELSELETKLSSNAIDAVAKAFNLGMSSQEFKEFKQQTIADAQAITNEWELESCPLRDTKES